MLLVTPSAAADFLSLSKSTLAKMRISGRGPNYRKLGRLVRYEQGDLERWSDLGARTSTSDAGNNAQTASS